MNFSEILKMALTSVGANKLRSALTMLGITIGVFSVISVMTAIGAMQASIETGLTLFGSNIFQFAKYPVTVHSGGRDSKKYENRRDINYREAQRYAELMEGYAPEVCLKVFDDGKQAVYNGVKTTPSLTIVGTNKSFLAANAYTLAYGRNLNEEDVALSRRVLVVGRSIEERLFPHESPIGRVIKLSGHTFTIIGVLASRGTAFGMSQDDICALPITRFFEDFGSANRTINIATQSASQLDYNRTFDRGVGAMRIARGLRAEKPNDFEIYTNDSLEGRLHLDRRRHSDRRLCHQHDRAPRRRDRDHEHHARERDRADERDRGAQIDRRAQSRHPAAISYRSGFHLRSGRDLRDLAGRPRRRSARALAEGGSDFSLRLGDRGIDRVLGDRDRVWPLPGLSRGLARSDRRPALRVD